MNITARRAAPKYEAGGMCAVTGHDTLPGWTHAAASALAILKENEDNMSRSIMEITLITIPIRLLSRFAKQGFILP